MRRTIKVISHLPAIFHRHFDDLADKIRDRALERKVLFITNSGNYGDALIRYATKAFFRGYGISNQEINIDCFVGRAALIRYLLDSKRHFSIQSGGGAWANVCRTSLNTCRFMSIFTSNIIVLPTTFALPVTGVKDILYRRNNFGSEQLSPNALFTDDVALYLANRTGGSYLAIEKPLYEHIFAFRTDNESNINPSGIPLNNKDFNICGEQTNNGDDFIN